MTEWIKGRVTANRRWNAQLCSLQIQAPLPPFEAGQFVRLGLEVDGELLARPYSLVNPPGTSEAEIYFNLVPGGPLSHRLFNLRPGEPLQLSARAAGFFTLAEVPAAKHLWLLATGTGIGPYLSMLRTPAPWQRFERIILVHGVKRADDLAYSKLRDRWRRERPNQLCQLNAVTTEPSAGDLPCRITQALTSGLLEDRAGLQLQPQDSQVMLCGNPTMVADCLEALTAKGLHKNLRRKPGEITREVYQ